MLVPLNRGVDPADLEPGTAFHAGRGLCRTHHRYATDRSELDQYPLLTRTRGEVVSHWAARSSTGSERDDIAKLAAELDMSISGVRSALVRAGLVHAVPRTRRPGTRRRPRRGERTKQIWSHPGLFDPDDCDEGER